MDQVQIPCLRIPNRTTWGEVPTIMQLAGESCEAQTGSVPPMLIFEPYEESRLPHLKAKPSDVPEELIVMALGQMMRQAALDALERVAAREPNVSSQAPKSMKIKPNTPMKSIFRQMSEMPATVFSITSLDDNGEGGSAIFFLRTAFTVSEFRREIQLPIG